MPRRTKEEAEATRTRLLDTAEQVFERRGVSRTSLQEIAEAAGVTRGAIYWHFKDKADLFDAMMRRVTLPLDEVFRHLADDEGDPLAALKKCFVEALRRTAGDPQARRVFEIALHKVEYVDEMQTVRARRIVARDEALVRIEKALRRAARRGQIGRRVPARAAALGLLAMIKGLMQNWMLDPGFDLVRVGGQLLDVYLAGLAPSPAGGTGLG